MSKKPKYIEPTPELVEERRRVIETLCSLARGTSPLTEQQAKDELGRIVRLVEGDQYTATYGHEEGDAPDAPTPQFSYMPVYRPHIEGALRANNLALAACLALSVYFGHEYEQHMPAYGQMIRAKQHAARESAAKRLREGNNALARIDAYERQHGIILTPDSPEEAIAACAAACGHAKGEYSAVTIRKALKARARSAKAT